MTVSLELFCTKHTTIVIIILLLIQGLLTLFEMLKFKAIGSVSLLVFMPATMIPTTTDGTVVVLELPVNGKSTAVL